jgi:uncharacterized Zn-finger protein
MRHDCASKMPGRTAAGPNDSRALGIGDLDRYGAARFAGSGAFTNPAQIWLRPLEATMTENIVPHFHNTPGVPVIEIGAKEFMCIGEKPPFDHPHIFLDMGDAVEIICPYCSTLFRYEPSLDPHAARPAECALTEQAAA